MPVWYIKPNFVESHLSGYAYGMLHVKNKMLYCSQINDELYIVHFTDNNHYIIHQENKSVCTLTKIFKDRSSAFHACLREASRGTGGISSSRSSRLGRV